jgi:hypothetical protein
MLGVFSATATPVEVIEGFADPNPNALNGIFVFIWAGTLDG